MMYVIDESVDEPIMLLDKHIGYDSEDGPGIDGALFAQELLRLDNMGKRSIQVYINCPGGSVIEGMSIFNAILKSKTPVDTHNIGIAASMGGVVFMAGRKRIMSDYAALMVHNPSGSDNKAMIESMTDSLSTMLSAKAGISKEDVSYLMKKETWLNSAECFAKGFCTEITITSEHNKKRMSEVKTPGTETADVQNPTPGGGGGGSLDMQNPTPGGGGMVAARAMWKEANEITNNIFNINKNQMKKLTAKLKLTENANEDAVLEAITNMENSSATALKEAKDAVTAVTNKATALGSIVSKVVAKIGLPETATEGEIETVLNKLIEESEENKEAAKVALEGKVKDKIEAAVKVGKIKNDATIVASWTKLLTADFEGTEKLIDEIPLNKVANKIENVTGGDNPDAIKAQASAAGIMLEIQNKLSKK